MEEDPDIEVLSQKRQKLEPPPRDGKLKVMVHMIWVNAQRLAFSKTKRNKEFNVEEAGKYLINFNGDRPYDNNQPPKISAANIHKLVICHFGALAEDMIRKVKFGTVARVLSSDKNNNNPEVVDSDKNSDNPGYDVDKSRILTVQIASQ